MAQGVACLDATRGRLFDGPAHAERRDWAGRIGSALVVYFSILPLLWLLGLVLPFGLLLMAAAAIVSLRSPRALRYAWPWYALGCAQLLSVVVNWAAVDGSVDAIARHLLAAYVSGWFLIGAAVSTGAAGLVSLDAVAAATRRIAAGWLVIAVPTAIAAWTSGADTLSFVTPLGMLLPDSLPSKSFAFTAHLFTWDDLFGIEWPRIFPLFPWANVLGLAGIAVVMMSIRREHRRWGLAFIGTSMVVASLGRMPIVTLLAVVILRLWLEMRPMGRLLSGLGAFSLAIVLALVAGAQIDDVAAATQVLNEGRPGSSQVRDDVYDANWNGFYQAPWIGHGWPGDAVFERDDTGTGMVVGSHSSISGLLYKGGALSFSMLVVALLATSAPLLARTSKSADDRNAFCFMVALAMACSVESIESFALPLLFVFVWVGAVLGKTGRRAEEGA